MERGTSSAHLLPANSITDRNGIDFTGLNINCLRIQNTDDNKLSNLRSRNNTEDSMDTVDSVSQPTIGEEQHIEYYMKKSTFSDEHLKSMLDEFNASRIGGRQKHMQKKKDVKSETKSELVPDKFIPMLDTFMPTIYTDKSKQSINVKVAKITEMVYAIDLGGSTCRIIRVNPGPDGQPKTQIVSCNDFIHEGTDIRVSTSGFSKVFDYTAKVLNDNHVKFELGAEEKSSKDIPLGFTFSFPTDVTGIKTATLKGWTKEWHSGEDNKSDNHLGKDIVDELQKAINKINAPFMVVAIANDTVGTMLTCQQNLTAEDPPCRVGIIVGTGVNGCYIDPHAVDYGYTSHVINTELGACLMKSAALDDEEISEAEAGTPQFLEKICSARYLPMKYLRLLKKVYNWDFDEALICEGDNPFNAEQLVECSNDTGHLSAIKALLQDKLQIECTPEQLKGASMLAKMLVNRSAVVMSVVSTGLAIATGTLETEGVTVSIDGSLYTKNPSYATLFKETSNRLLLHLNYKGKLNIRISEDGSGMGAALLAASCAGNQKNKM